MLHITKIYEKKSNIVYNKIINKLQTSEAIIVSKSKLERTLRLENHSHMRNITKLRNLNK